MSDSVEAVSEVSSSSSSSSSHETHESHESSSTQSTSETSSSSSSSSTSSTEETHEINTSDSTSISHDASEADEADGGSSVNMNWLSPEEAIEQSAKLQEAREPIQDANETVKQILVDYERSYMNDTTYDIEDLPKLDKYHNENPKDNNCANFQSSISDTVGTFDKGEYDSSIGCSPDSGCKTFGIDLGEQGYERVNDASEVKVGDIMVKVKSNGKGHTEMITEANEDGTVSMIGSNNNGDNIQEITEHPDSLNLSTDKTTDVGVNVYHKDFSVEELDKVAESLDTNAVAANSAEKIGQIEEKLADDSLSKADRETLETQKQALESLISDIDKFSGELETIHNILDGKDSESAEQASDLTVSDSNFATAPVEQKSESFSNSSVSYQQSEYSNPTTETNSTTETDESKSSAKDTILNKISEVSGSAMESIKGLVDKIFG